jgi:hypothetical protein
MMNTSCGTQSKARAGPYAFWHLMHGKITLAYDQI